MHCKANWRRYRVFSSGAPPILLLHGGAAIWGDGGVASKDMVRSLKQVLVIIEQKGRGHLSRATRQPLRGFPPEGG